MGKHGFGFSLMTYYKRTTALDENNVRKGIFGGEKGTIKIIVSDKTNIHYNKAYVPLISFK